MNATMRAYRMTGWQQPPELVEVPRPVPGPGQVLVRVAGCGLCHSDLSMMAMPAELGEQMGWEMPFTFGHETAGWIEAIGEGVEGHVTGDPVALVSPAFCGACRWCRLGKQNRCTAGAVGRGYGADGGLAEYVLVSDAAGLLPLGSLDPRLAGPLTDAGATSHHAVQRIAGHVGPGSTVVVIGIGGLGAFVVQLVRACTEAQVVAIDPDPVRRGLAREYGAAEVLDGVGPATSAELAELLGATPADAVVDLVGTDATIKVGLRALGPGGAFALVGAAGGSVARSWYASLPRDGQVFTFQGSDVADAQAVIDLAAAGRIKVETVAFPLDRVADAYKALDDGSLTGRIVVVP